MIAPMLRILGKDLRRFWLLAAACAALTAISAVLPFHPPSSWMGAPDLAESSGAIRWFLIAYLALSIAQDDPAEGDRGGWLARPVGAAPVLGAKLLFLAAFLALPAALAGAWAAGALADGAEAAPAAAAAGALTLYFSLLFAVLGSVTRTLLRAILLAAGAGVVLGFAAPHFSALSGLLATPSRFFGEFPPSLRYPWIFRLELGGGLAACLVLLIFQYHRRRTARTLGLVAVLAPAIWLAGQGWPWFAATHPAPRENPASQPPPAALVATSPHLFIEQFVRNSYPKSDVVRLGLQIRQDSTPPGIQYQMGSIESRLTVPGERGFVMARPDSVSTRSTELDEPEKVPAEMFTAVGWPAPPRQASSLSAAVLSVPRSAYDSLRGKHGQLDSWIRYFTYRYEALGAPQPFGVGAAVSDHGTFFRIRSYFLLPDGTLNVATDTIGLSPSRENFGSWVGIVLINRARNEIAGTEESMGGGSASGLVLYGHTELTPLRQTWNRSTHAKGGRLTEEWIRGAEFQAVTVNYSPVPRLTHVDWGDVDIPDTPAKD